MSSPVIISAVSPVYKSSPLVEPLVKRLSSVLSQLTQDFEIILVEDCGPDDSWAEIQRLCNIYPYVKGIKLSRNFGQQYAIQAGLDASVGEYVVTLDCDLQDPPEEIEKLYNKIKEGYEIAIAIRESRKDNILKKFLSQIFYIVLSYLTETKQDPRIANFVMYRRKVITALASMKDYRRYYPMMVQWVGFNSIKIPIEHAERLTGSSSYSLKARLNLALNTMLSFSDKPLRITVKLGLFFVFLSILSGISLIVFYYKGTIEVQGWTSLVVLLSFFSGIIIIVLGMLGLYIGQMFETVKNRPSYIISERINIS